ncbi:pyridoxal phosphate-dependent transferase [Dunaliella salina]|uniref:Pyridoxal phosphate-dependent transferase n=1 Tax=Dunaliella salina TaxID=3046 RepID=A0ABQ7GU78_DUNSA|nr:pyridoxal phosphate-dependent transferase [Dunaliella salina]|eukprot:KAF5838173.1 pyridoxal phosphate-dependent transferase [Dunaliella salina]
MRETPGAFAAGGAPQAKPGLAMDFSQFQYSQEGQLLQASSLAALVNRFRGMEGVINMSAGLPCPTSFPLASFSATTNPTTSPSSSTASADGHATHLEPPLYGLASQRPRPWYQFRLPNSSPPAPSSSHHLTNDTSTSPAAAVPSHQQGNGVKSNGTLHPPLSHAHPASTNGVSHVGVAAQSNGATSLANGGAAASQQQQQHQQQQQEEGVQGSGLLHVSGQLASDAQQYMFHSGHPPLLQWTRTIVDACHAPPRPTQCVATAGAVHALQAAVQCLCDPGDFIICEEFAYTHAPECVFTPRGLHMLPVAVDEQGMVPDALLRVLQTAGVSKVTGRPPRVIYIIPTGQNPTGADMGVERKRAIYEICRAYNLVILEDDAYYWLQFPHGAQPDSQQPGLCLPPSLLSFDVDGRVLRIDTFAKILGPGYRLGWITAPPPLAAKMAVAVQASCCGPASISQVVISELLNMWGLDGFEAFVRKQQAMYARRCAVASSAAREHLKGLVTFEEPTAGMFMWFKLTGLPDFGPEVVEELVAAKVVVVPGKPFWTAPSASDAGAPCPYFRTTFGSVKEDQLQEGFARLGSALKAAESKKLSHTAN